MWRAPDGSEVLTHWMAHGYGHGDMIASGGLSRALGLPVSWADRRPSHVDKRVTRYLADLRTVALTPYRLLTIGYDFVRPVPRLVEILDGWNHRNHERTGVWLVNATIADYLDLVDHHRDRLPTIALDPNPYWMGFYASRPEIKAAARELGRRLVAREAAQVATQPVDGQGATADSQSWWVAATSNHHDFVTGTAPDRVALGEQTQWLNRAIGRAPWPPRSPSTSGTRSVASAADGGQVAAPPLEIDRDAHTVVVRGRWGSVTFDSRLGGAATAVTDEHGSELLGGPSLIVASYVDSGGLWRMGQEIHGGRWSLADRSDRHDATIEAHLVDGGAAAEISVRAACDDAAVHLRHTVRSADRAIVTHTTIHPRRRRSITLVIRPDGPANEITMHQPGGVLRRPIRRWYDPTFWPLHSFAATSFVAGPDAPSGAEAASRIACATASPTALHVDDDGAAHVIVARAPFKELAFGVVPVMAPAWGWRTGAQEATVAWTLLPGVRSSLDDIGMGRALSALADSAAGRPSVDWPVSVEDPDVEVIAAKPASRGSGVVVRLRDWVGAPSAPAPRTVQLLTSALPWTPTEAWLTDSRERDLRRLHVDGITVDVPLDGHLTSVRLIPATS